MYLYLYLYLYQMVHNYLWIYCTNNLFFNSTTDVETEWFLLSDNTMKSSEIDIPEMNVGGFLPSIKSTECIKPHESIDNMETQQGTNNWSNYVGIYEIYLNITTSKSPLSRC